jgi:hypothetical protein
VVILEIFSLWLVQNLLQWTSRDHPDCSLLLGSEKVLRETLSRCHSILEQDVQIGDSSRNTEGFTASRLVFLLLLLTFLLSPRVRGGFQLLSWRPWMNPQKPPAATGEWDIT